MIERNETALLPTTNRTLPTAVRGEGVWIYDENGKDYLDGSSGAIVANLGQCHPDLIAALTEQAEQLTFAHRTQFRNRPAEELAEKVTAALGDDFNGAIFVNSGSEANELALKLAFFFWAGKGYPQKTALVTTTNSYHGNTIASIQVSGQPRYSANFRPLVRDNQRLRAPYIHRIRIDESISDPASVVLARLREDFAKVDHARSAAVLIETIGGAAAGTLVPPPGYFELLRELCDEHGLLWIADEVMTGFGRTGEWFAFQHWGAAPDIVTFAKGVSGGHAPLAGVGLSRRVRSTILEKYGAVHSGHTYSNNPVTAAVGLATMNVIQRDRLIDAVGVRGDQLGKGLAAIAEDSCSIVDVRGIGLMWGVEFGNPETGEPLPVEDNATARLIDLCAEEGLLVYPSRGGVDGVRGDSVMIAPPLVISSAEIDELLVRLQRAVGRLEDSG